MKKMGIPERPTTLLRILYAEQQGCVRLDCGTSDWFDVTKGVCQGCPVSPPLFNLYTDDIFREIDSKDQNNYYEGVKIGGMTITDLRYADDVALLPRSA